MVVATGLLLFASCSSPEELYEEATFCEPLGRPLSEEEIKDRAIERLLDGLTREAAEAEREGDGDPDGSGERIQYASVEDFYDVNPAPTRFSHESALAEWMSDPRLRALYRSRKVFRYGVYIKYRKFKSGAKPYRGMWVRLDPCGDRGEDWRLNLSDEHKYASE
ncbi:hypothetical protein [Henriciella aquimarina]|uniref:hypothetical protein n=1 Tax=Henriciella aquimarina TaxID=545261 RepID=UPI00117B87A9|nr:hypothetical protein [Henriciella aquimarina]